VNSIFETIKEKLDRVAKEIQTDLEQEREMREAMKELKRNENNIKYKSEIMSRPKKEWF